MNNMHIEVVSRFQDAADADHLLYTPVNAGLKFRKSKVYTISVEGDMAAAREYLLGVLVDPIAQEHSEKIEPMFDNTFFVLDYGMKAGALDLEKEAILENYRGRSGLSFTIRQLKITQRVYIFGEGDKKALSALFAKDVCNPAIHNWTIS